MASQKKLARRNNKRQPYQSPPLQVSPNIQPITTNQEYAFDSWEDGDNLMLHGTAGTGKTFIALYLALASVLDPSSPYKKVFIVRSTVPSRDQGFLPGTQKQKEAAYEDPYTEIASEILERGDGYQILKQKDLLEFKSTSYLRGTTLKDCVVVVDEAQNMSFQECDTIITRMGEDSKVIFCGDIRQDDLTSDRKREMSGLRDFMKIIKEMDEFDFIEFTIDDIVRSSFVKSYIIAKDSRGL